MLVRSGNYLTLSWTEPRLRDPNHCSRVGQIKIDPNLFHDLDRLRQNKLNPYFVLFALSTSCFLPGEICVVQLFLAQYFTTATH